MSEAALGRPSAAGGAILRPDTPAMRVGLLWLLLLAGQALAFPGQFADPFIRSDDFPAIFPQPEIYHHKTLTEGRWINWLWMLRSWPTDPVVLQWLFAGAWSLTAALIGVGIARAPGQGPAAALIALAVVTTPQVGFIALWFGTLLPGFAILALWAGVVVLAPRRVAEWGLLAVVPVLLMTHTALPFAALAIVAGLARGEPGLCDTIRLGVIFVGALLLGLGLVHLINGVFHGVFGIVMPAWREPNPLESMADLRANLSVAAERLLAGLPGHIGGIPALTAAFAVLVAGAAAALLRAAPGRALAVLMALGLGLAVPAAHMLLKGVPWPFRASLHVHIALVILAGVAYVRLTGTPARAMVAVLLVGMALFGALVWNNTPGAPGRAYQAETRSLAARIAALGPGDGPVLVTGQSRALPGADVLQNAVGLRSRLELLTGRRVHLCTPQAGYTVSGDADEAGARHPVLELYRAPFREIAAAGRAACSDSRARAALAAMPAWPRSGHVARLPGGGIGVSLPERRPADTGP